MLKGEYFVGATRLRERQRQLRPCSIWRSRQDCCKGAKMMKRRRDSTMMLSMWGKQRKKQWRIQVKFAGNNWYWMAKEKVRRPLRHMLSKEQMVLMKVLLMRVPAFPPLRKSTPLPSQPTSGRPRRQEMNSPGRWPPSGTA